MLTCRNYLAKCVNWNWFKVFMAKTNGWTVWAGLDAVNLKIGSESLGWSRGCPPSLLNFLYFANFHGRRTGKVWQSLAVWDSVTLHQWPSVPETRHWVSLVILPESVSFGLEIYHCSEAASSSWPPYHHPEGLRISVSRSPGGPTCQYQLPVYLWPGLQTIQSFN